MTKSFRFRCLLVTKIWEVKVHIISPAYMFQSTNFMSISLLEMPYPKVFWVGDKESEIRFSKFKMADSIWPSL